MVEVGVEGFSFGNFCTKGRFEMVTSRNVVNVVDRTRSHSDFREIGRPDSSVGSFGLILRVVRSVYSIGNDSISFIPLLVVVLFKVVVSRVDGEVIGDKGS